MLELKCLWPAAPHAPSFSMPAAERIRSTIPASDNGGTEGGGFYDNEMIILSRDKNATTIDNAIVYDVNNGNQGVIFGSLGYDYPFSAKFSGSVNAGFAAVD